MTLLHQAAQKAVEALKWAHRGTIQGLALDVNIAAAIATLEAALQQQPEPVALSLSEHDMHFLACRLRRLFKHFKFPLPDFASKDASLIGIAGSVIGMLLTRWETEEPMWHAVISEDAPGINKAIRRADVADEYAQKCLRDGYTRVEVVPLYTAPPALQQQEVPSEPVAVIGSDYTLLWAGGGPIARIVDRHGLKVGSLLYASPSTTRQQEAVTKENAMPYPYTVIESVELDGTQWGVSLDGPNPEATDYYACTGRDHAWRLYEALTTRQQEAGITAEFEVFEYDSDTSRLEFKDRSWWHKLPAGRYTLAATPSTPENAGGGPDGVNARDGGKSDA